jgi:AraC family transcriptional regulator
MDTRQVELLGLPYNITDIATRTQQWNGVRVDITRAHYAEGEILHPLGYENMTRLSINLDEVGGITEPRLRRNTPCVADHKPRYMAFAPAGIPLWGYSAALRYCYDATVMFNLDALSKRLEHHVDRGTSETPKLRYTEPRIWSLVNLLVDLPENDMSAQLFGDSVTAAIFAIAFESGETHARSGTLASWQLNRVIDYMRDRLPQQVELQELATLVGLSQWHFARAFKASTGQSPYQWQLDARVQDAKKLLMTTEATIETVAEATGFGDAMHLIRHFKKKVGATPAKWRKDHLRSEQLGLDE